MSTRSMVAAFLVAIVLNLYFFSRYRPGELKVRSVSLKTNLNAEKLLLYCEKLSSEEMDFGSPYPGVQAGDRVVFALHGRETRTFRIYCGPAKEPAFIEDLQVNYPDQQKEIRLNELRKEGIVVVSKENGRLRFEAEKDAYFELAQRHVSNSELAAAETLIIVFSLVCGWLLPFLFTAIKPDFHSIRQKSFWVSLFLISIFLPHPWFNVLFIVSFLYILRDFRGSTFTRNPVIWFFLGYFFLVVLNSCFFSRELNWRIIETCLPLFFLPFYVCCIPASNYLRSIVLGVSVLVVFFICSSATDVLLYRDLAGFSFYFFTKYLHPVYFSYAIAFSIIAVQLDGGIVKKLPVLLLLFAALLFCGSKLMISVVLLFYLVNSFRLKQGAIAMVIILVALVLFPPTRSRFEEVLDRRSLSVLSQDQLSEKSDPRLNGVSLRLIIWQEALTLSADPVSVLIGNGVDKNAEELLENRLVQRGLRGDHVKYDPHNQFITNYYKLGLIGVFILLLICFEFIRTGILHRNKVLLWSTVIFIAAMFTESVLQRAVGIYFFTALLLIQVIFSHKPFSAKHIENSDPGDQRSS